MCLCPDDPLEWSEAITAVLQKLAAYYGAERAYLAIPMDDGRSASFYEWRQEGAVSKETLKTRLRRPEQLSADERAQLCRVVALDDLPRAGDQTAGALPQSTGAGRLRLLYAFALRQRK